MRSTIVDHHLELEQQSNQTVRMIEVDHDVLDALQVEVLKCCPSSIVQLHQVQERPKNFPGLNAVAINALGLETSQPKNMRLLIGSSLESHQMCRSKDGCLLEVIVGNRNAVSAAWDDGELCHAWTLYVMLPGFQASKSQMIKQVVYNLQLGCGPDTYTLHTPNFELECVGRASSSVTCTIHWNPILGLRPTAFEHELVPDGLGGRTSSTVSVNPRRLRFFT